MYNLQISPFPLVGNCRRTALSDYSSISDRKYSKDPRSDSLFCCKIISLLGCNCQAGLSNAWEQMNVHFDISQYLWATLWAWQYSTASKNCCAQKKDVSTLWSVSIKTIFLGLITMQMLIAQTVWDQKLHAILFLYKLMTYLQISNV